MTNEFIIVDGKFTDWSDWYDCDVSCGGGIQWRNRSCIGPFHGGAQCDGNFNDNRTCNENPCPGNMFVLFSHFNFVDSKSVISLYSPPVCCRMQGLI